MKIALIMDGMAVGGAEKQCAICAVELARNGQDVEVIRYHGRDDFGEFLKAHRVKSIALLDDKLGRVGRINALARYLKRARFDVVHAFKGTASIYGRLAARIVGVPCIFGGYRSKKSQDVISRWVNRILSFNTAGWIVNSAGVKENVIREFGVSPRSVYVVTNAVRVEEYRSHLTPSEARMSFGFPRDRPVVSIIGNLRREKNHEMFFRVARCVLQVRANVHFAVAGDGPRSADVRTACFHYGLGDRVSFLGQCEQIPNLLRATDVVVLTTRAEGLPNVIIEAGAAGVACVSTDNGAGEVIQDGLTGYIVPVEDVTAMTKRVLKLLDQPALRIQFGELAKQVVSERFSPEKMVRDLINVYERGLFFKSATTPNRSRS